MIRLLLLCLTLLAVNPVFALRPVAAWWAKPDTLGLKYRQVELTTADRVKLVAWLTEPSPNAIAGTRDQNTPLVDSAAVVQAARRKQHRQLFAVDCGHLGAQDTLTEKFFAEGYVRAISRFLGGGKA